jgi:hypothetical protein
VSERELVDRRKLVSSARELTAEGKYQLKPADRGWPEMVADPEAEERPPSRAAAKQRQ